MGLSGKLIAAVEFKAGGDVFHELLRHNPDDLSTVSPDKVQGCDLHEGQYGHVGSIIAWRYARAGEDKWAKQEIQAIDEEKKLIQLNTLEGDVMKLYKTFVVTIHVETNNDIDLVTWTIEYEMLNEDVEHPILLLSYFIHLTKDIETHHLTNLKTNSNSKTLINCVTLLIKIAHVFVFNTLMSHQGMFIVCKRESFVSIKFE